MAIDTEALYVEYRNMVFNVAKGYENDWSQQQDLADDCWVAILEALPQYEDQGHRIGTWIHTVAENVCKNYVKAKEADKRRFLVYEHEMGSTEFDWDPDYEDEYLDVRVVSETLLDNADGLEWLKAEELTSDLEKILSVGQKQCLTLKAEGYDSNEIGEELGISASAVRTHIERAREKVREYLEG
jgi:RNA polymerase sigma-70 factor (ECF subfamily)